MALDLRQLLKEPVWRSMTRVHSVLRRLPRLSRMPLLMGRMAMILQGRGWSGSGRGLFSPLLMGRFRGMRTGAGELAVVAIMRTKMVRLLLMLMGRFLILRAMGQVVALDILENINSTDLKVERKEEVVVVDRSWTRLRSWNKSI
jgi:hypothetical protein